MISSPGSTGFATNILNPTDNARARSSILTYAIKATAGMRRQQVVEVVGNAARQFAHGFLDRPGHFRVTSCEPA